MKSITTKKYYTRNGKKIMITITIPADRSIQYIGFTCASKHPEFRLYLEVLNNQISRLCKHGQTVQGAVDLMESRGVLYKGLYEVINGGLK